MEALKYALFCYAITAIFAMIVAVILHGVAIVISKLGLKDEEVAVAAAPTATASSAGNEEALVAIAVAAASRQELKKK